MAKNRNKGSRVPKTQVRFDVACPECGVGKILLREEAYGLKELDLECVVDNPHQTPPVFALSLTTTDEEVVKSYAVECDTDQCSFSLENTKMRVLLNEIKRKCVVENPHMHHAINSFRGSQPAKTTPKLPEKRVEILLREIYDQQSTTSSLRLV